MEIRSIQPNYYVNNNKSVNHKNLSFQAGVKASFLKEIVKDPVGDMLLSFPAIKNIKNTNFEHMEISGIDFDPVKKNGEFLLSGTEPIRAIPGLEFFEPERVKADGWTPLEALTNIDMSKLKEANIRLRQRLLNYSNHLPERYANTLRSLLEK